MHRKKLNATKKITFVCPSKTSIFPFQRFLAVTMMHSSKMHVCYIIFTMANGGWMSDTHYRTKTDKNLASFNMVLYLCSAKFKRPSITPKIWCRCHKRSRGNRGFVVWWVNWCRIRIEICPSWYQVIQLWCILYSRPLIVHRTLAWPWKVFNIV